MHYGRRLNAATMNFMHEMMRSGRVANFECKLHLAAFPEFHM